VLNLRKSLAVIGATSLLSFTSLGFCGDNVQVASLEKSLPQLVVAGDYRAASSTAFRLASLHSSLGDSAAACAALSQSLEYFRAAVATDSGLSGPAASALTDNMGAVAQIRARFGCTAG
jgi:hypothetical protein